VLHNVVRKLGRVLILALLTVVVSSAIACGGVAPPASPEPATSIAEQAPTAEPTPTPEGTSVNEGRQADDARRMRYVHDNDIKFERISLEQGLSDSTVFCILQDSKGFMWFGTHDGLNKYDGYDFTVYRHNPQDPNSLSDNTVWSIHEDRSGMLWIGTDGGGLDKFDRERGRFVHYQNAPNDPHSLSNNSVRAIYEDQSGVLWIGTEDGLNRFDRENEQFIHYRNSPNDPNSLSHNFITAIYEDQSGVLWVGTFGGGLDKLNRKEGQFIRYQTDRNDPNSLSSNFVSSTDPNSLSNNFVLSVYEDQSGILWIGTWGGLSKFDRESGKFTHYQTDPNVPHSLSHNYVLSIYEDHSGVLWVGTGGGGLDRFDRETERFIHYQANPDDPYSLSNDRVWSIYQDHSGVLWVGTGGGGLDKLDRETEKFTHYQTNPTDPYSLSHNNVLAVCEDLSGVLWIGTGGGGLNRLNRESGRFVHYQNNPDDARSLSHNTVACIYQDRAGILWIGTFGGLNRFEQAGERFIRYQNDPDDPYSLGGNSVRAICEDQSKVLWIGTGRGLDRLDRKTGRFTHYQADPTDPNSLSHNNVLAIHEGRSGVLWIGTFGGGLDKFDRKNETFTHYQSDPGDPNSLSDNNVASIYEDQSGVLWIGTFGGGLNKFDQEKETFTHYRYREDNGLPSDAVYGILEDDQGCLWLSTNNGLSKFDPRTETFKNYNVRDGLQSDEFNVGAYHKSGSGEMFFGGGNGFNAFYPDCIRDNPYVPPVVLTLLTQGGEELVLGKAVESLKEVTFTWPSDFFEFEFAALSYVQPEKNQYAYMLEGFEQDWNYIGTRRFGKYTNIPGGTYTLRMRGSNNDGIWNEQGTLVDITIVPPFWETWWFIGTVALILVGGAIGGYRLRVKSIEVRNRELEKQVEERTYEIERRRQVAEGLREILIILNSDRSLKESLDYIVSQAALLTGAEEAIVFRREKASSRMIIAGSSGGQASGSTGESRPADTANMPAFTAQWITRPILKGEPLIVPDLEDYRVGNSRIAVSPLGEHRALLGAPVSVAEKVAGGLVLFYAQERSFSKEDLELGFTFADQAALAIANAQLRDRAEQTAVETERSRLARDLHDAVTQTLFSASLIGEALPTVWESDQNEGRQLLQEMRRLSRGALAEMRTLLLELRPTVLVEASLGDLLRQLAEAVTGRKDVTVTVTLECQCSLPTDVHVALYRIAQEALNNVVKHAHASQVAVSLRCFPPHAKGEAGEGVELRVSDDGRGFDPDCVLPDRLGLIIIRERAQAIGATLTVESQIGHGTEIVVTWSSSAEHGAT
jgi:ligand-binding sensor domain-containing protein/signal transduction histidine kinase